MRTIRTYAALAALHALTAYIVLFHPAGRPRNKKLYAEVFQGLVLSGIADSMFGGRR